MQSLYAEENNSLTHLCCKQLFQAFVYLLIWVHVLWLLVWVLWGHMFCCCYCFAFSLNIRGSMILCSFELNFFSQFFVCCVNFQGEQDLQAERICSSVALKVEFTLAFNFFCFNHGNNHNFLKYTFPLKASNYSPPHH